MTRRLLPLLTLLGLLLVIGCGDEPPAPSESPRFRADGVLEFLRPDGSRITAIAVEIAEGDSAQARGLMQRRSLPERGGMLFIDDAPEMKRFWMKNTYLPLDIVFVAADSEVVNIAERARPLSEAFIRSTAPAQYVVEVRGGFAEQHGLTDSTRIRWRLRDQLD